LRCSAGHDEGGLWLQELRSIEPPDAAAGWAVDVRAVFPASDSEANRDTRGGRMSQHVYKTTELVGSSTVGVEDAVQKAIAKAAGTIRNLRWFEVTETRGHIEGAKVAHWQVTLKIGFTLEE
jgi:flavin-binding protein dodecin